MYEFLIILICMFTGFAFGYLFCENQHNHNDGRKL